MPTLLHRAAAGFALATAAALALVPTAAAAAAPATHGEQQPPCREAGPRGIR